MFSSIVPIGSHLENTSLSTAVSLSKPNGCVYLLLQSLAQNIRYRFDGISPDNNTGFQLTAGDPPILIDMSRINQITIIEETSGAIIQYQWCA